MARTMVTALALVMLMMVGQAAAAASCVAHRGASGELPENSIEAFEEAERQGATGLELDLRLTSDYVIVAMHDTTLDRTTNCTGTVRTTPYRGYIEYCDISAKEKVPTLDDILDFFARSSMWGLFDIKAEHVGEPLIELICDAVNAHPANLADRLVMATWTPGEVERTIVACTESPSAWVSSVLPPDHPSTYPVQSWNININAIKARPEFVTEVHDARQTIFAWTINDVDGMIEAASLQVDAIITDYPARCVETIGYYEYYGGWYSYVIIPTELLAIIVEQVITLYLVLLVLLCASCCGICVLARRYRVARQAAARRVVLYMPLSPVAADEKV